MLAMSGCTQPEDDPTTCVLEYGGKAGTRQGAGLATAAWRTLHRPDAAPRERALARCVLPGLRDAQNVGGLAAVRRACAEKHPR